MMTELSTDPNTESVRTIRGTDEPIASSPATAHSVQRRGARDMLGNDEWAGKDGTGTSPPWDNTREQEDYDAQHCLARRYHEQGEYVKAEVLYVECLETETRVLGANHMDTLRVAYTLAHVYFELHKWDQAEALLVECLERNSWLRGHDHPQVFNIAENLATLYEWKYGHGAVYDGDLTLDDLGLHKDGLYSVLPDSVWPLSGRTTDQQKTFNIERVWFGRAAKQGHAFAQYALGVLYDNGLGVDWDREQAVFWFKNAASQGHQGVKIALQRMCSGGLYDLLDKDEARALCWFKDPHTQWGWWSPESRNEAVSWYRKRAELGRAGAQNRLAIIYTCYRGKLWQLVDEPVNESEAFALFTDAAYQGNVWAQLNLGTLYANGIGDMKRTMLQQPIGVRRQQIKGWITGLGSLNPHPTRDVTGFRQY